MAQGPLTGGVQGTLDRTEVLLGSLAARGVGTGGYVGAVPMHMAYGTCCKQTFDTYPQYRSGRQALLQRTPFTCIGAKQERLFLCARMTVPGDRLSAA